MSQLVKRKEGSRDASRSEEQIRRSLRSLLMSSKAKGRRSKKILLFHPFFFGVKRRGRSCEENLLDIHKGWKERCQKDSWAENSWKRYGSKTIVEGLKIAVPRKLMNTGSLKILFFSVPVPGCGTVFPAFYWEALHGVSQGTMLALEGQVTNCLKKNTIIPWNELPGESHCLCKILSLHIKG